MIFKETEKTELKRIFNETIAKEIVAFLNTVGGVIYIGVDDNGEVLGVQNLDEVQKKIADIITTQILPNPQEFVEVGSKYVDGKNVVEIEVGKGNSLYYIKKYGRSAAGCYIRVGTSCRSMTEEQIESRFKRAIDSTDTLLNIPSKWTPVTFTQLKIYYESKGLHLSDETMANNLELFVKGTNDYNRLAELLSDKNRVSVQFARFHGKNKASFAETSEYGNQCLITAIERMINRLEAENFTKSTITSKQRIDKRLIDMDCLKEAFYNAIAHNDWNIVEPAVYMFDDRIEIISYGGLPTGETEEMFYRGISKPRNPALMRILRDLGYVERTGHGIPNIVTKYGKSVFEIAEDYINIVFPFDKDVLRSKNTHEVENEVVNEVVNEATNEAINEAINEADRASVEKEQFIFNIIKQYPKITIKEIQKISGYSKATIDRIIVVLKEKGLILGKTSNKSGTWIIL